MTGADIFHHADASLPRGTVYPTLTELEKSSFVTSRTVRSARTAGPPTRYYKITALGRRRAELEEELVDLFKRGL
jgi:DNA-binding PadR family transcriptional regulator